MTIETVVGYIVSALSAIAFWTIRICHTANKSCVDVDSKIITNFKWAYKEFGNSIPATSINEAGFCHAVERIYGLHLNMRQLLSVQKEIKMVMRVAAICFLLVVGLFLLSLMFPGNEYISDRVMRLIGPLVVLVVQVLLLFRGMRDDNRVSSLQAALDREQENRESDWKATTPR